MLAPAALAALALVLCAAAARAHDQPFSEVDVRLAPGRVALELTVHRVDAAGVLGVATPESLLVPTFLHERDGRLAALLAPRLALAADGVPLALRWRGSAIRAERRAITLRFDAPCPHRPGRLGVGARLFPTIRSTRPSPTSTTATGCCGGRCSPRDGPPPRCSPPARRGVLAVCLTFVPAGIHHILIGPDHILFLIGLLLLGGGWRRVLKIATGFTVAHSITLALAALELVQPPARLIEPAIALSVALVGLDNLRGQADATGVRCSHSASG